LKSRIPLPEINILETIYVDENVVGEVLRGLIPQIQGGIRRPSFPIREKIIRSPAQKKKKKKREPPFRGPKRFYWNEGEKGKCPEWNPKWTKRKEIEPKEPEAPDPENWQAKDEREVLAAEGALDGIKELKTKDPSGVLLDAVSDTLKKYIGTSAINRVKQEARNEWKLRRHVNLVSLDKMAEQGDEPDESGDDEVWLPERPAYELESPEEPVDEELKQADLLRRLREDLTRGERKVLDAVERYGRREAPRRLGRTRQYVCKTMKKIHKKGLALLEN
jgi:hypothetical protein